MEIVLFPFSSESHFQSPTLLLFQKFWIRIQVRKFFGFENPTPVQTQATIDAIEVYPCFSLRNDHADSCYCRNGKVTPDLGPVFQEFLTPALRIRGHHWRTYTTPRQSIANCPIAAAYVDADVAGRISSERSSTHVTGKHSDAAGSFLPAMSSPCRPASSLTPLSAVSSK